MPPHPSSPIPHPSEVGPASRLPLLIIVILFIELYISTLSTFAQQIPQNEWFGSEWDEFGRPDEFWWMWEAWPIDTSRLNLKKIKELPYYLIPSQDTISSDTKPKSPTKPSLISSNLDHNAINIPRSKFHYQIRTQRRYGGQTESDLESYNGSPWAATQRLRGETGAIRYGAVLDKDAFEPSAVDLWRVWLGVKKDNIAAIFGDYHITVGRGLILWTKPVYFEAYDAPGAYRRTPRGLDPAGDSAENSSFRGAAAQVFKGQTEILTFVSEVKLDAVRGRQGQALRLSDSGLHRTAGENVKRDAVVERCAGGSLSRRWRLGETKEIAFYAAGFINRYEPGLQPEPDLRTPHPLKGRNFQAWGIGGSFAGLKDSWHWESSRDKFGHIASELCLTYHFSPDGPTFDASAAHIPEGFSHPRMRLSINEAAAGQDFLAFLLSGKGSRWGLDSWKAHFEAQHYPRRTYTVPQSFTALKSSLELSWQNRLERLLVLRIRHRAGLEGNGETIPPDKYQEYRLRLILFPAQGWNIPADLKIWGETAFKTYLGKRIDTGNALGGSISLSFNKSRLGAKTLKLELNGCRHSTENKFPIYLSESFPQGRWTTVRLSGQGFRSGLVMEWQRNTNNGFGLAIARNFSLDSEEENRDWEIFANMSLTLEGRE